jgi:hypothetical protein
VVNGSQTKVNNVASKPIAGVSVVKDVSKNKLSTKPIQISRQTNSSLSSRETVTSVNQNEQKTSSPGVDAQSVTNGTTALGNQSETAKKEIDRGDETDKFESIIRKITRENQKEYFHRIETGQTHIVTNKVLDGNEINEDATENYNRLTNKIRQAARDFAKQNKESYSSLSSSALTIMHDELSKIILSDGYNEKMDAVYDKAKKLRAKSERQP